MPEPAGPAPEALDRARPEPGNVRRNPVPSLLTSLLTDTLDPGYAEAARGRAEGAHRSGSSRRVGLAYLLAGAVLAGVVFGVAARTTELNAPADQRARDALIADIGDAQANAAGLESSASSLAAQLRASQLALGAGGPLQSVAVLGQEAGLTPVTGPGLQIVINSTATGQILDRDVQLLVNSLWAAGAQAVAVGDVRLRTTSAIRQAGGAILVDNRPVFWPMTISAIGDPATLHVQFVQTPGFARFASFASLYGTEFDVTAVASVTLPAAAAPDLQYAAPMTTTATTPPPGAQTSPLPGRQPGTVLRMTGGTR